MADLAILTKSYRDDFDYFRDLHESVLRFSPDDVVHHVVVPDPDLPVFAALGSQRLRLLPTSSLLPCGYVSTCSISRAVHRLPGLGSRLPGVDAINLRHPWPPIRGWILQQLIKLAVIEHLDARAVLVADSDAAFIRPLTPDLFLRDGVVRFYRSALPLTPDLKRHAQWHRVARRLLGLGPDEGLSNVDYVSSPLAFDPRIVRRMLERVREMAGRPWLDATSRLLDFSESILYGCFVDLLGTPRDRSFTEPTSLCHVHWGDDPLTEATVATFVDGIDESDVAIVVQSKSRTSLELRREIIVAAQQRQLARSGQGATAGRRS